MKILIINGPNINLLGKREPNIYGKETYSDLINMLKKHGIENDISYAFFQSQSEGSLIEAIHTYQEYNGIVINPAAYSHYSVAILDAISAINIPTVEVHISNIYKREQFRHSLITAKGSDAIISGMGLKGYIYAADYLKYIFLKNVNEDK